MAGAVIQGQIRTGGDMAVAPSPIPYPSTGFTIPRELAIDEIEQIEDKFAEAARRAQEAGYGAVSLHCTHQALIEQFLSPLSNHRNDAYGGDFSRRLRFLLEIISKIKQKVGDDFPVMCRISGEEVMRGGLTIMDTREIARRLEAAGVDCISVCFGASPFPTFIKREYITPLVASPMASPRGELVHLAAAVKEMVSIPVMTANRIVTPELAEQILEQDRADFVCIGRGLLADPEWPKKAREGRESEIRHCIACGGCNKGPHGIALTCSLNAAVGREKEAKITPSSKVRTVFVAGGGPAGLEAARVAALRGHKVRLYEKDKLGGQLNLACIPPGKSEVKLLLDFEKGQLNNLGVKIENKELTLETVNKEKPDAVIVATGAHPIRPKIPGSSNKNVVTAWQVLEDGAIPKKGRIVVIGGNQVGAETAEYLASKGNQVTILEMLDEIARDIDFMYREFSLLSLESLGVNILTRTTVEEIKDSGVIVNRQGQRYPIEADTVVLAVGSKPNQKLANQLKKLGIEHHIVGDCAGVGNIFKAVHEGFDAGLAL